MKQKIKSLFLDFHPWQVTLLSIVGAVLLTNLITTLISYWFLGGVQVSLIMLGTLNAIIVPVLILPGVIRLLRRAVHLDEEIKSHAEMITQLEKHRSIDEALQRRADEMALLYRLGVSLTSGKNLYETLLALQAEIVALIQADAFYVAIYDEQTDLVHYPIFFDEGNPLEESSRLLHEWPGLTGAVIFSGKTLYLPDMFDPEVEAFYRPHNSRNFVLHTFLGIPLRTDGKVFGMLSVQSKAMDAYTPDQVQLMENIALQAATSINKTGLLDRLKEELDERTRAEGQLRQREMILEAVTFAAEKFLKVSDWRENIDLVLGQLGKTLDVTHAYLFEHHVGADDAEYSSLKYEWTRPGFTSDFDNPEYQTPHPVNMDENSTDHYLRKGNIFIGNLSTFPESEKDRLVAMGVKRMVELPIFVHGKWWGTFGFDDFVNDREWSNAEVDALKIAAGVLGAAIQRRKTESAVAESERIYRQAIEGAGAVPYFQEYSSSAYRFMGAGIQNILGYKPEEMTSALWNSIVRKYEFSGELKGMDVHAVSELARNGKLKYWQSDCEVTTRDGAIKWVADTAIELFDNAGRSYGSVGILQDITERKQTEFLLRKRESLLDAVTFSAEKFLNLPNWRDGIDAVLERLGGELGASHAYLFEFHSGPNGEKLNSMCCEWVAPGQKSDLDNPAYQNASDYEEKFKRYYEILNRGEPFVGSSALLADDERSWFNAVGIRAILEMRIALDGGQWGTLGFDDMAGDREWMDMEVDVIKVAAGMLGAAIKRQVDDNALKNELAERRRVEQSLRASEERFYKTFEDNPVAMIISNREGQITLANAQSYKIFGYPDGELVGLGVEHLVPESFRGKHVNHRAAYTEYPSARAVSPRNLAARRKDGAQFPVEIGLVPLVIAEEMFILASVIDLTERRRAEAAIRLSEEKFSKAFHTTQVLMTIENERHVFVDANQAFMEAFGYERDEIIGHSASELNIFRSPQDAALLREELKKNDGVLKDYELPFRRKTGDDGFVLLSSEKIKLDNAEYILTSGLDITERKRTETALHEEEARYRALFEQSHDAVFLLDLNANHIDANQRAADMLGFTMEELSRLTVRDLSAELSESEKVMQRVLAGEHIPTFERLFKKKSGEIFPVEINVELVRDDMGTPLHIQSVIRDVTQRKLAEAQIQNQAARAEALASLSQTLTQTNQDYRLLLDTMVRRCAELIGDGASIFSFSPENEFLELVTVYNKDLDAINIFREEISKHPIRWNEGAYAKAIGENQPVLIPFISIDALIEKASPERKEYYKKLPIHSMMLAPLHVQGKILGVIGMARHSAGRNYTPEDLTFLQDIADRSALAMLNAQYYSELEHELAERKRAEEKYRSIFNNSIDGIFQSAPDGYFVSVNPAMARIYGYDSPEDMLDSVKDIRTQLYVDTDQRTEVRRRLNAGERLTGYETLDLRKDGSSFWSSMNAQAIFDENGAVLYYEGTVEDITPRKEAEAEREKLIRELATKNAESETLRETTSIVTSTLDVSEAVQRILEQLKRVIPYDSASVWLYEGNVAHQVGSDGLPDSLETDMSYTSHETEPDYHFLSRDVSFILLDDVQEKFPQFRQPPINYIRGWMSVALKARGKLIGFISLDSRVVGRFTERDAHLAINFANQVSIALENARLFSDLQQELDGRRKLIGELENKNAELEQFTYTVSHDLKSPLVTINGFLGYLEQDAASGNLERLRKDMQRIYEAVQKMQRLLNELLELSRIGRMMNASEETPFAELAQEALEVVHGRLTERRVTVQTQPNLPLVYGDKPRLIEALQNLLDNAAKYMGDQSHPRIEIGQRGEEDGKPVFYVQDNGMGIAPEHHERIFGLFNKLDAKSEGTGVGLALVKRIIEIHGCRIWVESEPGMGSTFLFTLPVGPSSPRSNSGQA